MNREERRKRARLESEAKRAGFTLVRNDAKNALEYKSAADLCSGIQYIIDELNNRGVGIYDFDDKKRVVRQIQIFGDKAFFLAEREE